jgi:hypothetical protein
MEDPEREVSLGIEEIRSAVRAELRETVTPVLGALKKQVRTLEAEVWGFVKGARGGSDAEWSERLDALQNWESWGVKGSGFGHLPEISATSLRRLDVSESEEGSAGEEDEEEVVEKVSKVGDKRKRVEEDDSMELDKSESGSGDGSGAGSGAGSGMEE